jgi:hypothetical protein
MHLDSGIKNFYKEMTMHTWIRSSWTIMPNTDVLKMLEPGLGGKGCIEIKTSEPLNDAMDTLKGGGNESLLSGG